jgi:hypothetical protein
MTDVVAHDLMTLGTRHPRIGIDGRRQPSRVADRAHPCVAKGTMARVPACRRVAARYVRSMPPCMDVYVWIPDGVPSALGRFIERYVDCGDPSDDRLGAFIRVYVEGTATDDDRVAVAELRRGDAPDDGLSIYVHAYAYYQAIMTITCEGAAVLGLSIDDPDNAPEVEVQTTTLIERLRAEFESPAGRAGVELPPAHSREEWGDDGLVMIRAGDLCRKAP